MRALVIALLALAAVLPGAAWADTHTPGFQLQADGLMFGPIGKVASQQDVAMSDLFGSGGGYAVTATLGLSRHWVIGVRAASYRSKKTGDYSFDEIFAPPGQALATGSGPYRVERELKLVPLHAILQYRRPLGKLVEVAAEGGVGMLSTTDHMTLFSTQGSGILSSLAGYQKDTSWSAGLGLAWAVPANLDVVAGARYIGTLSGDGAAWLKGDDPGFTNWTLGLRYPHNTQ